MLWANGNLEIDGCTVVSHVGFERAFRLFAIERRGLFWETRFAPAHPTPGPGNPVIYLLLDGRVTWAAPGQPEYGPGSAFLTSERLLAGGQPSRSLRASGEPFRALQLLVDAQHVVGGVPPEPRALVMNETIRAACERVFADLAASSAATDATRDLVRALVEGGISHPSMVTTVRGEESAQFVRCWKGVAKHYMPMAAAPSLQDLAQSTGLSLRQFTRDVAALVETFLIGAAGFRGVVGDARLRCAVLLLSAPAIPIARVAKTSGYGSVQALGRALRDAGMPAPSVIRRELGSGFTLGAAEGTFPP
jgi:AraC-like DNA-binding protein